MLEVKVIEVAQAPAVTIEPQITTTNGKGSPFPVFKKTPANNTPHKLPVKKEDLLAVESDDAGVAALYKQVYGHRTRYNTLSRTYSVFGGDESKPRIYLPDADHIVCNQFVDLSKMIDQTVDTEELALKGKNMPPNATIEQVEENQRKVENLKRLRKLASQIRTVKKQRDLLTALSFHTDLRKGPDDWDSDGDRVQFSDGYNINLRTGELKPSTPDDHFSKALGVPAPDLNKDVSQSLIVKTIEKMFPDPEVRNYFRICCYETLIGSEKSKILPYLVGPKDSMKTGILTLLFMILGDYGVTLRPEDFDSSTDKRFILGELAGARGAFEDEGDEDKDKDGRVLKWLSGAENLKGEKKFKERFTFKRTFTPWGASNHLPPLKSSDEAIWGRIRLFQLTHVFSPDRSFIGKLEKVESLQDLFIWIYGAREQYLSGGIHNIPEAMKNSVGEWREKTDWPGRFISECMEQVELPENGSKADYAYACSTADHVYKLYRSWREAQGISRFHHPLQPKFMDELKKRGIDQCSVADRRRKDRKNPNSSKEPYLEGWRIRPEIWLDFLNNPNTTL